MIQEKTHKHVAEIQIKALMQLFANESKEQLLLRLKALLFLLDVTEIRNIYEYHFEEDDPGPTQDRDDTLNHSDDEEERNPYIRV